MHPLAATASSSLSLAPGNYIYSIVASTPGTLAAISSDDSLRVFDAATLTHASLVARQAHDHGVTCLQTYRPGHDPLLATGGRDGKLRLWDVRNGNGSAIVETQTSKSPRTRSGNFALMHV